MELTVAEKLKLLTMADGYSSKIVVVGQGCGKYLFNVPEGIELEKGDKVLCDTKRGVTDGTCLTHSVVCGENALEAFALLAGAKLPLKSVVGKYKITMFEKENEK